MPYSPRALALPIALALAVSAGALTAAAGSAPVSHATEDQSVLRFSSLLQPGQAAVAAPQAPDASE
jgi:hypothetical protein